MPQNAEYILGLKIWTTLICHRPLRFDVLRRDYVEQRHHNTNYRPDRLSAYRDNDA